MAELYSDSSYCVDRDSTYVKFLLLTDLKCKFSLKLLRQPVKEKWKQ